MASCEDERPPLGAQGPLTGIRVLDFSRVLAGPFTSMVLADQGAEVIKVEAASGDDTRHIPPLDRGVGHYFLSVNRNKRSVVIDLRNPDGRQVALDLAARSDVVLENFRPGVAERLGVDYEAVRAVREDIIYASITGYGREGAWTDRPAFDIALQALSGAMGVTGHAGEPSVRLGIPIGDLSAGLFAAVGVLAALSERERTGRGQRVDVAMLDSAIGLLGYLAANYFMTGESPPKVGGAHHSVVPYGVFPVADGEIVLAGLTESFWPKLCEALGNPELARDERLDSNAKRVALREEVDGIVGEILMRRTVEEWCERLTAADVPHAPVLTVGEALRQPYARERGVVGEAPHPVLGSVESLGPVVRFPDGAAPPLRAAPQLGADTRDVLAGVLGYDAARVGALLDSGAVTGESG